MYAHERSLVKRLENAPFALLGVNSDRDKEKLKEVDARIYVRRGGPNWEGGVGLFENLGDKIGIPVEAHGPAYHMTRIVRDAFEGKKEG